MSEDTPLMLTSYPRAILHVDGDAFFASVEQALDPHLRGKPLVTGKERGIIAAASYEAKALGIKRGITLSEAKTLCPDLIILPSDYESYSLYSKRMFNIMRKYTPVVEEYSIDEAFADITGLRQVFHCSYKDIAFKMQEDIRTELNIGVSIGLSLTKTLAKLCSKFRKPHGFTAVSGKHIHILLQRTPLEKVWGFGPNTVQLLQKHGLENAYDYVLRPSRWASGLLKKPGRDLWNELRGTSVWPVTTDEKSAQASIMKGKTFTPPSISKEFIYAKLMRNAESAFIKARRYKLRPRAIGVVLRHQDFRHDGVEAKLNRATSSTLEAVPLIRTMFESIFIPGCEYRATMIVLGKLESDLSEQYELFQDRVRIESLRRITDAVDFINRRYGKHSLCTATALFMNGQPVRERDEKPERHSMLMKGENQRQRLNIPRWNVEWPLKKGCSTSK